MTSWNVHSSCPQWCSLLFTQCYLCCDLQLAKYLCLVIILCNLKQLWSTEFTKKASGLCHNLVQLWAPLPFATWQKISAIKWMAPLLLYFQSLLLPITCLVPPCSRYHYNPELLCKTAWAKPMGPCRQTQPQHSQEAFTVHAKSEHM